MLPILSDKLEELSNYVIIDIPDSVLSNVDKRVELLGVEGAFNEELHYLDCTRYTPDGKFRLMQTVGVPYSVELGKAIYIIGAYSYDGENLLLERHRMNLEYEKEHPPVIYKDKNKSEPKTKKEKSDKPKKERKPKQTKEEKRASKLAAKIASFNFTVKI